MDEVERLLEDLRLRKPDTIEVLAQRQPQGVPASLAIPIRGEARLPGAQLQSRPYRLPSLELDEVVIVHSNMRASSIFASNTHCALGGAEWRDALPGAERHTALRAVEMRCALRAG